MTYDIFKKILTDTGFNIWYSDMGTHFSNKVDKIGLIMNPLGNKPFLINNIEINDPTTHPLMSKYFRKYKIKEFIN